MFSIYPHMKKELGFQIKSITSRFFVRNVIWTIIGLGIRTVIQAIFFIVVARALGPDNYGLFTGVRGLVLATIPFAGWGSGIILIKHVSRDPERFPVYWGTAITVTFIFGLILCALLYISGCYIFSPSIAFMVVIPVALGDLWGLRYAELSAQAFQAFQHLSKTSRIYVALSISRLLGALIFWGFPHKTIENWSLLYMGSGLFIGILSVAIVSRELGWGQLGFSGMRNEWRNGFYFCISTAASGIYNDIDKTFLTKLSGNNIAGMYAAAYRILDAVYIPVQAIVASSFPRFFKSGASGLKHSFYYAKKLLPWTILISGLAWILLLWISQYIPIILGSEYSLVPRIVIWLGPILIFRAMHNILANALTGADYQGARSAAQMFIAIANIVLNFVLIPSYGWVGALLSSLISDSGLVLILLILTIRFIHRENQ